MKNHKLSLFYIIIRKICSIISIFYINFNSIIVFIKTFANIKINIGRKSTFGAGVKLAATDGGAIYISDNVKLEEGVHLIARGGVIKINSNVFIGRGSIIVACDKIEIGQDTMISEYVVIRDQDHIASLTKINSSGFNMKEIIIGNNVWIGCKASVLRGSIVGNNVIIGAHALVNSTISDDSLAVGIPARVSKKIINNS